MKFGTMLKHPLRMIFGYRAIPNFAYVENGGYFSKWPFACNVGYRIGIDITKFTYFRSMLMVIFH